MTAHFRDKSWEAKVGRERGLGGPSWPIRYPCYPIPTPWLYLRLPCYLLAAGRPGPRKARPAFQRPQGVWGGVGAGRWKAVEARWKGRWKPVGSPLEGGGRALEGGGRRIVLQTDGQTRTGVAPSPVRPLPAFGRTKLRILAFVFLVITIEGPFADHTLKVRATALPVDDAAMTAPTLSIGTLITAVRAVIPTQMARIENGADVFAAAIALNGMPGSRFAEAVTAENTDIVFLFEAVQAKQCGPPARRDRMQDAPAQLPWLKTLTAIVTNVRRLWLGAKPTPCPLVIGATRTVSVTATRHFPRGMSGSRNGWLASRSVVMDVRFLAHLVGSSCWRRSSRFLIFDGGP